MGELGRIFQEKGGDFRVLTLTMCREKCIYENMNNCSCIKNTKNEVSMDVLFELSEFFKFFGDTTRIRIIHLLLSGEVSVNDIAEKLNLEQSVVSHQLRILRTANLVKPRRDGRKMFYSLDDEHIGLIFNTGLTHILHKKGK
jgi:DNA-binding transcriptional ArsR family regulator